MNNCILIYIYIICTTYCYYMLEFNFKSYTIIYYNKNYYCKIQYNNISTTRKYKSIFVRFEDGGSNVTN